MDKRSRRIKRHIKIKTYLRKSSLLPQLSIFRSNKYIYAQLIDSKTGEIIASASEKELTKRAKKTDNAFAVGALIAKKALEKKIKKIVFDRGGYTYHGRVKNLSEGARNGGLSF